MFLKKQVHRFLWPVPGGFYLPVGYLEAARLPPTCILAGLVSDLTTLSVTAPYALVMFWVMKPVLTLDAPSCA